MARRAFPDEDLLRLQCPFLQAEPRHQSELPLRVECNRIGTFGTASFSVEHQCAPDLTVAAGHSAGSECGLVPVWRVIIDSTFRVGCGFPVKPPVACHSECRRACIIRRLAYAAGGQCGGV